MQTCCSRPLLAIALGVACAWAAQAGGAGQHPIALRAENFTVLPSTGPVTHVRVDNRGRAPWRGTITFRAPEGWRLHRSAQTVTVAAMGSERVPFAVEQAADQADNRYSVEVLARGAGGAVGRKQTIMCVSAPYGRPKIDGKADDWAGGIPVSFRTQGKATAVRTLWNRREFAVLIEVEEDKLVGFTRKRESTGFDAVRLAIAPAGAWTPRALGEKYARYEFLLAAGWLRDRCFLLTKPDDVAATGEGRLPLAELETRAVRLKVKRRAGVTTYECAIPFSIMEQIEPMEGREFQFSFLVHDPDGTGVRDWGAVAGLHPWQRTWLAWRLRDRSEFGHDAPYDSKVEWGFCSSRR